MLSPILLFNDQHVIKINKIHLFTVYNFLENASWLIQSMKT